MPIPEKEFQDEYKRIWARKTEVEKVIDSFKTHNIVMVFIALILSVCGLGVLIFLDSMARVLKEMLELIN